MDNHEKPSFTNDHVDQQIENAKANIDQSPEVKPEVEIKSQENVLNGLSDK